MGKATNGGIKPGYRHAGARKAIFQHVLKAKLTDPSNLSTVTLTICKARKFFSFFICYILGFISDVLNGATLFICWDARIAFSCCWSPSHKTHTICHNMRCL